MTNGTDTSSYRFTGYRDDDARMIRNILDENWNDDVLKDKLLFYYDESFDVSSVNYNTGEVAIKIYADETMETPMGIGFDSVSQDRLIHIEIMTIDRDLYLGVLDEIRRIVVKYRLRPGNCWDTMWQIGYEPVYPSEKQYHGVVTINLKQYCHTFPIPRDGWQSDTYH